MSLRTEQTPQWQQSANFSRLIVALATLAWVESWHDESHFLSTFFPTINEDSKLLWQQALFRGNMQMTVRMREQRRYHKHGRLVPELPTDDGVLLRKSILSEDCIKDLVRPLRRAGWQAEVGEPDESALSIVVVAKAAGEQIRVALLFSCATSNDVYRKLAKSTDVILYRGEPYNQQQYAYGLTVHVGPVTVWVPPIAPYKRHSWYLRPHATRLMRAVQRPAHRFAVVKSIWKYYWWRNRINR